MRQPIGPSPKTVRGKRILLTGGRGLLGHEVVDSFAEENELLSTDAGECDVTRIGDVVRSVDSFRAEIVIHCAAYTAVDRAETEEGAAMAVNAEGTRNVARICRQRGILLVTFGTDYVFDGKGGIPYDEEDPPAPLSAYGRSKLAAERAVRDEGAEHLLIRSQWLYGRHGRNFVATILDKAAKGDTLRVVNDQVGCPTNARDLAHATNRLVLNGARGTVHFSNAGETSWHGLAAFILSRAAPEKAGLLFPAATKDLSYRAARPAYSVLSKEKYRRITGDRPRTWEDAVSEFLAKR